MKKGFSLVELSIVLVILGLLVGGILAGQSLIRAAELRSITMDITRYTTAIAAFKDRYFGLPGDITNATGIWGARDGGDGLGSDCANLTAVATGTTTCNGDGDGKIGLGSSTNAETYHLWKQLQNAGLIEGNLAGARGPAHARDSVIGWNVPISRIANAGYSLIDMGSSATGGGGIGNMMFIGTYGNAIIFGSDSAITETTKPAIRSEEAWNIDTKTDDGRPGSGKTMGPSTTGGSGTSDAPLCTTSNVISTSVYDLAYTDIACSLVFKLGM